MVGTWRQNSPLGVGYEYSAQEPTYRVLNSFQLSFTNETQPSFQRANDEQSLRSHHLSPTRSTRTQRCTASKADRIRLLKQEAAERLADIEMRKQQLVADLLHEKLEAILLEANIANLQCYSIKEPNAESNIENRLCHANRNRNEPIHDRLPTQTSHATTVVKPVPNNTEPKPERRFEDPQISLPSKSCLRTEQHKQERTLEMLRPAKDTTMKNRRPRQVYLRNLLLNLRRLKIGSDVPVPTALTGDFSARSKKSKVISKMTRLHLRGMNTRASHIIRTKTMQGYHLLYQTTQQELLQYDHLKDRNPNQRARLCLLNVFDNFELIVSKRLIGGSNKPAASRSELGWAINGATPRDTIIIKDDKRVFCSSAGNCTKSARYELDGLAHSLEADAIGVSDVHRTSKEAAQLELPRYCNTRGARSAEQHLSYKDCTNKSASQQRGLVTMEPAYLYWKKKRHKETGGGGFH